MVTIYSYIVKSMCLPLSYFFDFKLNKFSFVMIIPFNAKYIDDYFTNFSAVSFKTYKVAEN
jgi:hypothetical protein